MNEPTHKHMNFTLPIETMMRMDHIRDVIGLPKEKLAILVIRALKRGWLPQ